ncbi:Efflux pump membrane transporter BepE [BD1-7 clade bacterium]|uniref:Efflux pump membrane transporter BepE n=1 Tax=BD1-7 clade bacterium TaxID=2029982 RepID=A0A5S9P7C5_9GAMM|nr:Efflux pump membrane transporter BepE [BD1-7 clade bacterium]
MNDPSTHRTHWLDRLVERSLSGGLPIVIMVMALAAGLLALNLTAREEEPQIVVPMIDVLVEAPDLSARQVERQVTLPLEKLLSQIRGVEHVYSTTVEGQAAVTLRFFVGEDREDAILNTYNKLHSNQQRIPAVVKNWRVQPVEVDDVPILMLALWSDTDAVSDFELRRLAEEISVRYQAIDSTSEVNVVGGRPRALQVLLDPQRLAARNTTVNEVVQALTRSNVLRSAGLWSFNNESIRLEAGDVFRSQAELEDTVINVVNGHPVLLKDVARVVDGPADPVSYTWLDFAASAEKAALDDRPMAVISIAKQAGSNAVGVANDVHALTAELAKHVLPAGVHIETLRDYGATADEKVNQLTSSLLFAVITVVIFIAVFLGWRPAVVVGLAVPICYGVTLALDMAFGYTINRVTLFALILSLGLLVDDPITGVDNIARMIRQKKADQSLASRIVAAMAEIRIPLVMSTVTIILAFIPLAFITGMMGPYMAPMAFNVPISVMVSTVVAFLVTPWLAKVFLKPAAESEPADGDVSAYDQRLLNIYRRILEPFLVTRSRAKATLWIVLVLFIAAAMLPMLRLVPLKLLPFDNKNEVQILIDMPESASLEQTSALVKTLSNEVRRIPEVTAVANFVGVSSPIDFNGMVRRYYQRSQPHMADMRLTLLDKSERDHQSHGVVLRLRKLLAPYNQNGITIKVVEVPPGPPVLSTLTAEIYGSAFTDYDELGAATDVLVQRLQREAHVVEVDATVQAPQSKLRFVTDKQKAALSGVSTEDVATTLLIANEGQIASYLQYENEAAPLPIELKVAEQERSSLADFKRLYLKGQQGVNQQKSEQGLESAPQPLVALGELGHFERLSVDQAIFHKDLKPVVYITAELSGRTPAEVIADVNADQVAWGETLPASESNDWRGRSFLSSGAGDYWQLPEGVDVKWTGEGEWRITVRVFRDMGLAFAFALTAIFIVLRLQTRSSALSLIIMSAIPLTIIGIMPGFWLLNQFGERSIAGAPEPVLFTATAMIGMIALAGIVVRNSLILVEFITQAQDEGMACKEALIQAGAVRMTPVLLTAGTTMLGNVVITLDPVFSGLAIAIIFGIVASTLFSLLVVPVVYYLVFDKSDAQPVDECNAESVSDKQH